MSKAKTISRWLVLAGANAVALVYLNSAIYRAWLAGGPPNSNPEGWLFSSINYLFAAVAFVIGGIAAFRLIGHLPSLHKSSVILFGIAALVGIIPVAREFIAVDICLDAGGRWSKPELRCEH